MTRATLAVVCAVAVASVYAGQPLLVEMGRDLGVPLDAVGWIVAVGQVGYLLGLVLLVPLGDVFDRRRLIMLHLALLAVGMAIVAAAPTSWVAFAGLASAGLFAVVVQTSVAYTLALSGPQDRGRNLGVVTSGVVIGILGGRIVAGFLADLWSWRSVYVLLAVLAALLAIAVLVMLPADERSGGVRYRALLRSSAGMFAQRVFVGRGLIAFFLFASFGTLWSGLVLPLAGAPWHLSPTQIGLFGVVGLAGALGAGRAGRWADAGRADRVTGVALTALLASWIAIGQLEWSWGLLIVGVILLDFAVQAVHVSNQHILASAYPDRTSTAVGAYMVFYSLGSALGAAATAAVYDEAGWTGSAVLGACFAIGALVVWALSRSAVSGSSPDRLEVGAAGMR
ncbi:MFS transporter [Microbacterium sp. ZW T6_19]|uniref:MFS transporter n=1 Tax=Microbacterium sp. ZW T6_19 TaxID=3378082 RepID=UPI003852A377